MHIVKCQTQGCSLHVCVGVLQLTDKNKMLRERRICFEKRSVPSVLYLATILERKLVILKKILQKLLKVCLYQKIYLTTSNKES